MFFKIRQKLIHLNSKKYHLKQHASNETDEYNRIKRKKKNVVFYTLVTSGVCIASMINITFEKIFNNCVLEDHD